jgi:excisionase family DNA binding protein
MSEHQTQQIDPNPVISYTVKEACRVTGIGRTKLYSLVAAGELQLKKIGRRSLIPAESLHNLINKGA